MPLILGVLHLPLNLGDSLLVSAKNCQPTALLMLQLMLEAGVRGWGGGKKGRLEQRRDKGNWCVFVTGLQAFMLQGLVALGA